MWWVKACVTLALLSIHYLYRPLFNVDLEQDWRHLSKSMRTWKNMFRWEANMPMLAAREDLKLRYWEVTLAVARTLLGLNVAVSLLLWLAGLHSFLAEDGQVFLILSWYCLSLIFGTNLIASKSWHPDLAACWVFFGIAIRVLTFPSNSPLFFINHAQRMIACIYAGFLFFDYRKAVGCTCMVSMMQIYRVHDQVTGYYGAASHNINSMQACYSTEVICLCFSGLLFYLLELRVDDFLSAKIDKQVAESSRQAAQRLLAVLCDADVILGHDLRILGRSAKLSHLLSSVRPYDEELEGTCFPDLLPQEDQSRFADFIRASSLCMLDPQSKDLKDHITRVGPPTSLQVSIRDAEGLQTLKVDVFHVVLPDIREPCEPCHLLGLREYTDITIASTAHVKRNKKGKDEHESIPKHKFAGILATEREIVSSMQHVPDSDDKSASSNDSSEKSVSSQSRKLHQLPQVEGVDLMVMLGENGTMPIESITINFDLDEFKGLYSSQQPDLQNWLLGSACCRLRPWLEAQANHFVYQQTCSNYGRMSIRAPIGDSKAKLIASDVTMPWADVDDDDGKMRAVLELRSLSEYRPSRLSKGVTELWQPMPIIDERR